MTSAPVSLRIAVRAIEAHPLLGLGPGAYGYLYKAYLPDDLPRQWLYTVHNEYLLRAAETGIPGGVAFVVLLVAALRLAMRLSRAAPYNRAHDGTRLERGPAGIGLADVLGSLARVRVQRAAVVHARLDGSRSAHRRRSATASGHGLDGYECRSWERDARQFQRSHIRGGAIPRYVQPSRRCSTNTPRRRR